MVYPACVVTCDHTNEAGQKDCGAHTVAVTMQLADGRSTVQLLNVTKKDIETHNVWDATVKPIIEAGKPQVWVWLCPLHNPKKAAAQQKQEPPKTEEAKK